MFKSLLLFSSLGVLQFFMPGGSNVEVLSGELCCVCESLQAWPDDQIPKTPDTPCSCLMSADVGSYLQEKQRGHSPGNGKLSYPPPTTTTSDLGVSDLELHPHRAPRESRASKGGAHCARLSHSVRKKKQKKKTSVSDSGLPKKLRVSRHRSKAH